MQKAITAKPSGDGPTVQKVPPVKPNYLGLLKENLKEPEQVKMLPQAQ
jgi:hypothetical protein